MGVADRRRRAIALDRNPSNGHSRHIAVYRPRDSDKAGRRPLLAAAVAVPLTDEKDPTDATFHGSRRLLTRNGKPYVYYSWTHYGDNGQPKFVRIR